MTEQDAEVTPADPTDVAQLSTVSDTRRRAFIIGGIPLGILLLLVASWGIDTAVSGDRVVRGVEVAGIDLGGLNRAEVVEIAADLNADLSEQPLDIMLGDKTIVSNPVEAGAVIDGDVLADAALDARRGGFFLFRPFRWLGTFFSSEEIKIDYEIDQERTFESVSLLVETELSKPIEPRLEISGGRIEVVPGSAGATLPANSLDQPLLDTLESGAPYSVSLQPVPLDPETDTTVLETVAAEATEATSSDIKVQVLDSTATISRSMLRSWVRLGDTQPPTWSFDPELVNSDLQSLFPGLGSDDERAHFNVVDGVPVIVPPSSSVICCDENSVELLTKAASEGSTALVSLNPQVADGDAAVTELEALGIIEEVSTFTTKHNCCENRVTNIQTMADIVRGYVVMPGDRFSLNEVVGQRTLAKGFLPAGAIADGVHASQVGGGVSQFTTTLFNAVFFAGLEYNEYQSHSIYFSRYPYGREATISWPLPNFIFTNNTPYGILIWPTYTDTTITVTFYSTEYIEVEDLGNTTSSQGACTRVTTSRQRTFPDGTVKKDSVFAVYRPGEGLDCNGNPTKAATPTTQKPTETTEGTTDTTTGTSETTAETTPTTATTETTPETTATTAATTSSSGG